MGEFWTLVGFEYKKLLKRRMVWITLGVLTAACVFTGSVRIMGSAYINGEYFDSQYHLTMTEKAHGQALSGTPVNQENLEKVQAAYAKIDEDSSLPMMGQEAYWDYAAPWRGIWDLMNRVLRSEEMESNLTLTEEEFYEQRQKRLEENWAGSYLTEGEKAYLRKMEEKVQKPIVYEYAGGYDGMIDSYTTLNVLQILLIAICVPMIFSEEHVRRTRALIMCTPYGKKKLYLAKMVTAGSFSLISTLFLYLVTAVTVFSIMGAEGFGAQMQNTDVNGVWLLSMGQGVLIMGGIGLVTALVHSLAACVLAEKTKSSLIPMAILSAVMLAGMIFNIPSQYRILAQIWDSLPGNVLAYWNVFSDRLIPFFGTYFVNWQALPVVYGAAAALLLVMGARIYRKTDK